MPAILRVCAYFGTGKTVVIHILYDACYQLHVVFDVARIVALYGMGSHHHEHIREIVNLHTEKGRQFLVPLLLQPALVHAPYVYCVEAAEYRIEPRSVDDQITFDLPLGGQNALLGYPLDWCLYNVDQLYILPIIGLVVMRLQRHAPCPESMVIRD